MRTYKCLLFVTFVVIIYNARAEVFSSTARLELLSKSTDTVFAALNDYIKEEEARLESIKRMMVEISKMSDIQPGANLSLVEHPIGAFHAVKKYADLTDEIGKSELYRKKLDATLSSVSIDLPVRADYMGSLSAILRLQRIYRLAVSDIMAGDIRDLHIAPLSQEDAFNLGEMARSLKFYPDAIDWYDVVLSEGDPELDESHHWRKLAVLKLVEIYMMYNDFTHAMEFSKWANTVYPDDRVVQASHVITQYKIEQYEKNELTMPAPVAEAPVDETYAALCRGDTEAINPDVATGYCTRTSLTVPYQVIKQEILSFDPFISIFYDVLTESEADAFKREARQTLYRALVGDPASGEVSDVRVGQLTWLDDSAPMMKKISNRIMSITGLDATMRDLVSSSEPFQVVNYGIGGHYEPHIDVYENKTVLNDNPDFLKNSGDRIATFLFYLDDVEEGGATVFPRARVRVPVVKYGAAFWYNLHRNGDNDDMTLHAGCPVLLGQKWVANKWIRERGQEFRHRCGLTPQTPHYQPLMS